MLSGRAEELLDSAKQRPGKNRCAAMGADWTWDRHEEVIGHGKSIVASVGAGGITRGLLHRLLHLIESNAGRDRGLRAARWAYQVGRNVSRPRGQRAAIIDFRHWTERVIAHLDNDDEPRIGECAASLRYALLATRTARGGHDV